MEEFDQLGERDLGRPLGEDPLRVAQAGKIRAETESTTLAGLSQVFVRTLTNMTAMQDGQLAAVNERWQRREAELVAREAELARRLSEREAEHAKRLAERESELLERYNKLAEANERLHERLNVSITSTSQNFSDMAALPAIVADHGKQMLEAQSEHLEKLRKPLEPRPTGAETASDAFKHLATQFREVAGDVFSSNPELRRRAARLLGGAIEKGEAVLGAGDSPQPDPASVQVAQPAAPPAPGSAEDRLDNMPLREVLALFQGLPDDAIAGLCVDFGLGEPFAASWRQMRGLLASRSPN